MLAWWAAPQTPRDWGTPAGTLQVRLLQGNIAQDEKFAGDSGVPQALDWYGEELRRALADPTPRLVVVGGDQRKQEGRLLERVGDVSRKRLDTLVERVRDAGAKAIVIDMALADADPTAASELWLISSRPWPTSRAKMEKDRAPACCARRSRTTPAVASRCAWTNEWAMVPASGTPNWAPASTVAVPSKPAR